MIKLLQYALKTRWLFLSLCFVLIALLFTDILSDTKAIEDFRSGIWANTFSHYIAFGTFIVAFAAWFGNVKRDWKESLPKRLSVSFYYQHEIIMQCHFAYLSGESDIRQMGQQIGAQISADRYLSFNIANVEWKEQPIICSLNQIPDCDETFFKEKLPFRHYTATFELSSLPNNLAKGYKYIWTAPFVSDIEKPKKISSERNKTNLQYSKKEKITEDIHT